MGCLAFGVFLLGKSSIPFNQWVIFIHFPYFSIAMIDCQRVKPTNTNFRQGFIRGAGYSWGTQGYPRAQGGEALPFQFFEDL